MRMPFQRHTLSRKEFLALSLKGAAGVLSAGFGYPGPVCASIASAAESLIPELTPYIRLYGSTATEIGGNAKLDNLKISVNL